MEIKEQLADCILKKQSAIKKAEAEIEKDKKILDYLNEKDTTIQILEKKVDKMSKSVNVSEDLKEFYRKIQLGELEDKDQILKSINKIINKTNGLIKERRQLDSPDKKSEGVQQSDIQQTNSFAFKQ